MGKHKLKGFNLLLKDVLSICKRDMELSREISSHIWESVSEEVRDQYKTEAENLRKAGFAKFEELPFYHYTGILRKVRLCYYEGGWIANFTDWDPEIPTRARTPPESRFSSISRSVATELSIRMGVDPADLKPEMFITEVFEAMRL
jgi:hypothetical protein